MSALDCRAEKTCFLEEQIMHVCSSRERTLNASAERDILNDFMLPTTLEQFGGGSFLHTTAQSKIYKDLHEQVWCGRTGLAYTESPLSYIEHLWDKTDPSL